MQIHELSLRGYKRLLLNRIQRFTLKPHAPHQLIIGTNGSGKSSVMAELTPLPPFGGSFLKSGSKVIRLSHRGEAYTLSSDFSNGSKPHSFIKGTEELNPGGTGMVQKELVLKHLGADKPLMDVLIGHRRFTDMSALQRRDWVMRLSGNDLSYPMAIYALLKTQARDAQGVVKHLNRRLNDEIESLPSTVEVEALTADAARLKEELTFLMENREPGLPPQERAQAALDAALVRTVQIANRMVKADLQYPAGYDRAALADTQQLLADVAREIAVCETKRDAAQEAYAHLEQNVNSMVQANAETAEGLTQHIVLLQQEYDQLWNSIPEAFRLEENCQARLTITQSAASNTLIELLTDMPADHGRQLHPQTRELLVNMHTELRQRYERIRGAVDKAEHKLEHMRSAKEVRCPKCLTHFIPDQQPEDIPTLERRIEAGRAELKNLDEQTTEINLKITAFDQARAGLRRLNSLISQTPLLAPMWNAIAEAWDVDGNPRAAIPVVSQWHHAATVCLRCAELRNGIQRAKEVLDTSPMDLESAKRQLSALEETITGLVSQLIVLRERSEDIKRFVKNLTGLTTGKDELRKSLEDAQKALDYLLRGVRHQVLTSHIQERQLLLAKAEAALHKARTAEAIIADIRRSTEEAQADYEGLTLLVNELSPVDGLIADQLKGFIHCFVDQMNAVIAQVWTHPLEIKPCGMVSEELDYLFPLSVNNEEPTSQDVAQTSDSQIEIVNLAFKLVTMLYLGLDDYPLYLDEVGKAMDEQHRFNLVNFIKQLVETRRCSQLFMISHYAAQHGAFTAAEVCVMDSANIVVLPEVYNRHVTMA